MSPTLEAHRALLERLPLVTYMVRLDEPSEAVFVSPQIEPLFGFAPADFDSPDFWLDRISPDDLPRFQAAFAELRAHHGQMSVTYRVAADDGRDVWVRDVGVVDRGDDGELYVHGYLTDVTREKDLERELATERAQAEAFFRDSPAGMGITDGAGRYLRVNEALARMNGASVADHAGRTLAELAPEVDEQVAPLMQRVRQSGESLFQHEVVIERDGGRYFFLASYFPIEVGGDTRYGRIITDVTDRTESENLFRAVFDGAFEGVVITNDAGEYVDVNPAACEMVGLPHDELIGTSIGVISQAPAVARDTWNALVQDGAATGQFEIKRPDGNLRDIEFSARANVLPGLHVSVLRDVTERRQLERDLWRAQRLESVGRLAGGVAQDFNNMLTAVRGYAQLLLGRLAVGSIEHHHAGEIDRAADRAAALTAQLLAFGRRQVLQTRPTELNRLVENVDGVLTRLIGNGVELGFDLDPGAYPVRVDPGQIEQVIVNLVVNAADATPPGGRIVVRTGNAHEVSLDDLPPGRYATLSVEDFGSGIDESAIEHLFEPFFTTKDVGRGIGLGLATAYGIAKQSGGTISVTSTAGAGSTFTLYLPDASMSRSSGETVLVIESDPAVREVLFEVLSESGYRPVTASTPTEALRVAERVGSRIDLVLTELDERRASGLAESLGGANVLTLQKPYSPERLRQAVKSALGG